MLMVGFGYPCECCGGSIMAIGHDYDAVTDRNGDVAFGCLSRIDPSTLEVIWTCDLDPNGVEYVHFGSNSRPHRRRPVKILICSDSSLLVAYQLSWFASLDQSSAYSFKHNYLWKNLSGGIAKVSKEGEVIWQHDFGPGINLQPDRHALWSEYNVIQDYQSQTGVRMQFAGPESPIDSVWIATTRQAADDAILRKYDPDGVEIDTWTHEDIDYSHSALNWDTRNGPVNFEVEQDTGNLWINFKFNLTITWIQRYSPNKALLWDSRIEMPGSSPFGENYLPVMDRTQFRMTDSGKMAYTPMHTIDNRPTNFPASTYDAEAYLWPFTEAGYSTPRRAWQNKPVCIISETSLPGDYYYEANPDWTEDPGHTITTDYGEMEYYWLGDDPKYIRTPDCIFMPRSIYYAIDPNKFQEIIGEFERLRNRADEFPFWVNYLHTFRCSGEIPILYNGLSGSFGQFCVVSPVEGYVVEFNTPWSRQVAWEDRIPKYQTSFVRDVSGDFSESLYVAGHTEEFYDENGDTIENRQKFNLSIWEPSSSDHGSDLAVGAFIGSDENTRVWCIS
jgi:hypothetical protein